MARDIHELSGILMTEAATLGDVDFSTGKAISVDEDGQLEAITPSHESRPSEDEVLIKTYFSGISPADVRHGRALGVRDTIAGHDFCGEVIRASSSNRAGLAPGDVVFGVTGSGLGRPMRSGTHQPYFCCREDAILRVPPNLPHHHAAALASAVHIAADAVFNLFGLSFPTQRSAGSKAPGPMLIWGASTSVGLCVLQYARAIGVRHIFVTASSARHPLLSTLGATNCVDYSAPDCLSRIEDALGIAACGPFKYAIDCVGDSANKVKYCAFGSKKIVSVTYQKNNGFMTAQSLSNKAFTCLDPEAPTFSVLSFRPRPAAFETTRAGVRWAIEQYGTQFILPQVNIFEGTAEQAIDKLERVGRLEDFGRTVIQHPMQ